MPRCLSIIAALLIFAACSKTPEQYADAPLTDFVPSQAPLAIIGNADGMLKGAGCRMANSHLTLTADLKTLASAWLGDSCTAAIEGIAAASKVADLSDCVIFTLPQCPLPIALANLRDNASAPSTAQALPTEAFGSVLAWPTNGDRSAVLLAADSLVWVLPTTSLQEASATIDSIAAMAAANPLRKSAMQPQADRSTLYGRILMDSAISNPLGKDFDAVLFSLLLRDRSMSLTLEGASAATAQKVAIASHLSPMDGDTLFAMPSTPVLSLCASIDRRGSRNLLGLISPTDITTRLAIAYISGSLRPDGGIAALAISPGGNAETLRHFSLVDWYGALMLPVALSPALMQVTDGIDFITVEESSDTTSTSIYNFNPDEYEETVEVAATDGNCATLQVTIPYLSESMKAFGLKNGYSLTATVNDNDQVNVYLKINGTSTYLLPSLISDLINLTKKWKR